MTAFANLERSFQEHQAFNGRATSPVGAEGSWPDPDMSVIWPERAPAPTMSEHDMATVFGPWASWVKSAANVKNVHPDYVSLALISAASSVIGNTRWAVPWDGWKEPPVIWGMLVGDPSSGKSPALDAVLDPIKELDAELSRAYIQDRDAWDDTDEVARIVLNQWKADVKAAVAEGENVPDKPKGADAGPPPVRKRVRITDATTESVADLMSSTWRGLLLCRDELSGWLGSMDRYSGGGDRPFWLEAFGGRNYTVDRKGKPEPIIVEHLSVSVLGGTQPDKMDSMLVKSDDDGLVARFLTVFPEPVPLLRPVGTLDSDFVLNAFRRLHSIHPFEDEHGERRPFYVRLDEDAQIALQAFREQCRTWEADASGLMKSHIGKLPGLSVRVALVLAHLDWAVDADGDPVSAITAAHIGRACHYVGEHLRLHAFRAYGMASVPSEIRAARRMAEIIRDERLTSISSREIQRRRLKGLQTAREIRPAITLLEEAGWLAAAPSNGAGRPSKIYDVNPKVGALT